jgi:hypothetical protein
MKIGLGIASIGKIDDRLLSPPEYSEYVTFRDYEKKYDFTYDVEFVYEFRPYMGFSLGWGNASSTIFGRKALHEYQVLDWSAIITPELNMQTSFVYTSIFICIPTNVSIKLILEGGVGVYFGSYESLSTWRTKWDRFDRMKTPNFEGNFQKLGYHLGACVDYNITEMIFVSFELVYRIINLDSASIELNTKSDSAVDFFRWLESKTFPSIDYEVSQFNLSGLTFTVGLKFQF